MTLRFDGKRTEEEPLAGHHNGDSVHRYIKVKQGNVFLYALVKVSSIPFLSGRVMIDFIVISGLILRLGC